MSAPILSVVDNRGLNVRQVQYARLPGASHSQALVRRRHYNAAGRLTAERDPRLTAHAPNQINLHGLSGARLCSNNVDAGWQVQLLDAAGAVTQHWDQRGSQWQTEYDAQLRPTVRREIAAGQPSRTLEWLVYGDSSAASARHNQCGRLIHHYDAAGLVSIADYALTGAPLRQTRRLLLGLDPVDWPASVLEPVTYTTEWHYNALDEVLVQTDAKGHRQHYVFDIAGRLKGLSLQLAHATAAQSIVDQLHYNAAGQPYEYRAGNGVVSHLRFDPADGRLMRITASKGNTSLQDTSYTYDPVGNLITLNDHRRATRYVANQRVDGLREFTYDSLNQLITATGLEAIGTTTQPQLPELITPIDLTQRSRYTQHYSYDDGGNLTRLVHTSPIAGQGHTRVMDIDPASNRAVAWSRGADQRCPMTYDASGNLHMLQPGAQPLLWNARDQLQRVTLLPRELGEDDFEHFDYGNDGNRVRTWRSTQAASVTHVHKQHYLPGLEVHTENGREELHVIVLQASVCQVRCLHWPDGPPDGIEQDALRFSLSDHQQSSLMELDGAARLISHEDYYPYGGTACWAARSQLHASYKTQRYSGKPRDRSGLYYYGARYYAPWLQRWISADPGGTADGLNLYSMVHNNPINNVDRQGLNTEIAYLIGGAAVIVATGIAAAASYFTRAPPAPARAPAYAGFDLLADEQERLQAFNKQLAADAEPVQARKLADGAVFAYVPKNPQHATDLSNASEASLRKQIGKGLTAIQLREAAPAPVKKKPAVAAHTAFEVVASTSVSRKKAERVAAAEEVVAPELKRAGSSARGAKIDTDNFFASPHFLKWDITQQQKITEVIEAFGTSMSAANYHRYSHDTEQDQNIALQPGKQRTLRAIHTLDVTAFEGTAGGRGDWRLVMYQINGVFYPQRMDRHQAIVARARR